MPVDLLAPSSRPTKHRRAAFAVAHCRASLDDSALTAEQALQVRERVAMLTSDVAERHKSAALEVGDGFEVRFSNSTSAVRFALAWHDRLRKASPIDGVPPILGGCGISLSRPGADADAASGRQTRETAAALARACAPGHSLIADMALRSLLRAAPLKEDMQQTDLGVLWLPHFEGSIHTWLLQPADAPSKPTVQVLPNHTNLPGDPPDFFGRNDELLEIENLFMAGEQVVCLVGPGGLGKSRLACRFAALSLVDFAHQGGVWRVNLSGCRGPDHVAISVAEAMGLPALRQQDPVIQVAEALAERGRTLVLLDDPDLQRVDLEGLLQRWCRAAPRAQFLVTAQQHIGQLTSLVLGPMSEDAASALFDAHMERATKGDDTKVDTSGIKEIVQRVDGIPLALELAAAWTSMLSPEQLLGRLNESLQVLSEHPARAEQTLNAVMERSWERLDRWERLALEQISIFRGGFTVEALESVLSLPVGYGAPTTMQVLNSLRARAMIALNQTDLGLRFSTNAVIQDFAAQSLARSGRRTGSWRRHAEWAVQFGQGLMGPAEQGDVWAVRRLAAERANLRVVAERFPSSTHGVRATLALSALHAIRGPFRAWEEDLRSILGQAEAGPISDRIRVHVALAHAELVKGRPDAVARRLSLVEEAFLESGRRDDEGHALLNLALSDAQVSAGDAEQGLSYASLAAQMTDESHIQGRASHLLGRSHLAQGDLDAALEHFRKSVGLLASSGYLRDEARVRLDLGNLLRSVARPEDAQQHYDKAKRLADEMQDTPTRGLTHHRLGTLHLDLNQIDEARTHLESAAAVATEIGDLRTNALVQGDLARVDMAANQQRSALMGIRACHRALEELGDRRYASIYMAAEGLFQHILGHYDDARRELTRALENLDDMGDVRFVNLVSMRLGALEADVGNLAESRRAFARVPEDLSQDPVSELVGALHRAHLSLAEGARPHTLRSLVTKARGTEQHPGLTARSADVRFALGLLTNRVRSRR